MYSRATLHIPKKYSYNFINIVLSFLGKCKTIELNSIELAYMPWNAPNEYERDTRRTSGNGQRINLMLLQTVKMCVWARKLNNSVNHKKVKLQTQRINWTGWRNEIISMAKTQGLRVTIMKFSISKKKNRKVTKQQQLNRSDKKRWFEHSKCQYWFCVPKSLVDRFIDPFFDSINEPNINKMITNEKHRHKHDNRRTNAVYGTRFIYAQT